MNKPISKECKCHCHFGGDIEGCNRMKGHPIRECEHCKSQPINEDTEDWRVIVQIMNHDWVVRLIKFGEAKIPEAGFYIFQNPELIPFIEKLLADQKERILQGEVMKDEKLEPCHATHEDFEAIAYDNGHATERNEFREEIRKVIKNA